MPLPGVLALIVALVVAAPPGEAAAKMYRIAVLANESSSALDGLPHGLRDLGYLEGRDVKLEYVWAGTRSERFGSLAAERVRGKPDFIITWGTPAELGGERVEA